MVASEERIKEVGDYYLIYGEQATRETFGLSAESLPRYLRDYKREIDEAFGKRKVLRDIESRFTDDELRAIAAGGQIRPRESTVQLTVDGDSFKFGFITDTHIGSKAYREDYLDTALDCFAREDISTILHTGDVVEGFSHRPGHIFELSHIGYKAQKDYAIEQLGKWSGQWVMIDGNHDRWYIKAVGAVIVEDICKDLPNALFLGHDEADLVINGGPTIRMWHGEDGSSYATSYRLQKVLEAFAEDDLPHVLLTGHTHKHGYFQIRGVEVVSGGSLGMQSKWMRSTRKENHDGFSIIEGQIADGRIVEFNARWKPLRSRVLIPVAIDI